MLLTLLRQAIKDRGFTLATVANQLSEPRSHSWLSRALDGQRKLALYQIDEILDIIGEPRELFWRKHLEAIGGLRHADFGDIEPAVLLRTVAGPEPRGTPRWLSAVASDSVQALDRDPSSNLRRLREFDQLRGRDLASAYQRTGEWIEECHSSLRARRNSREARADLIGALGVFASAARAQGQSQTAAFALSCAFDRLGNAKSGLLFADLLTRSASILTDQGLPNLAVSFLEQALGIFWSYEVPEEELRTALALGSHYLQLGRNGPALQVLNRCLKHPAVNEEQRAMAVGNLAWLHERQNQPEMALTLISGLSEEARRTGRLSTSLNWIEARALSQMGELYAAAGIFANLDLRVAKYCEPADPFLLFCDYAKVLIRLGDLRQLSHAAEKAHLHLGRLEGAPMLAAMAAEALEETVAGLKDVESVGRLRRQLASAAQQA